MPRPWDPIVARLSSLKESDRLRLIGRVVLVLGLIGAGIFYGVEARPAPRAMDDMMPGYAKSQAREMGRLMGHTGVMMLEWQEALDRPGTQAVIIAVVAALFASYFFRAAWVLDVEEQERDQTPPVRN